jgi:hypothetical protein
MQIIFQATESTDVGEGNVRNFLNANDEPSDRLYVTLSDVLATRSGPVLARELAQAEEPPQEVSNPSIAVDPARPLSLPQQGTTIVRPKPPGTPPNWWQRWIDTQTAKFETERDDRVVIFQTFLEGVSGSNRKVFAGIPAVQPNVDDWKRLFDRALAIAQTAIGMPAGANDDAYHFDSMPSVPPNLRSFWLLGELVHAQWQFEYMDAEKSHDIVAEYLFSKGAAPRKPNLRGQFRDWRRIRSDPEYADQIGAIQWSFGNWRPDIIDLADNHIFEIKPVRTAHYGVLQLWRYCHNYNCAQYFDWLEKPGAQGKEMPPPLLPGKVSGFYFRDVDPSDFLEDYFGSRSSRIPKTRRRAKRTEIESVLRRGGRIRVMPFRAAAIPGLVLYFVTEDKKTPDEPAPSTGEQIFRVVTGILIIVALFVAVAYVLPALIGGAIASGETAAVGSLVAGGVAAGLPSTPTPVTTSAERPIQMFDVALTNKEFEASTDRFSRTFESLNSSKVL